MTNTYTEYFKIGFKKSIEYKSYLLGVLITPLFMGFFFYFIWQYIFEVKFQTALEEGTFAGIETDFTIGGFTFEEMMVYLIIGLLFQAIRSADISDRISQVIKTGDISIYLCRPVNFVKSLLFEGIGAKVVNFVMFVMFLTVMTYLFGLPYPQGGIFAIFLVYAVLMILFDIILYVIIGGLAFWFVEIWGIKSSIEQILWILSGRVLPLTLFPAWFQSFMMFTPFMYLEFTFASLYLGKLTVPEALRAMGIFTLWIGVFALLMIWVYRKGFRKLEAFGG